MTRPSFATQETRSEAIARWEREGRLDPTCKGCEEFYETPMLPWNVFAPRHQPAVGCESGKRSHCSCSRCF